GRFMWVTGFALAMLAALGAETWVDALAPRSRLAAAALPGAILVSLLVLGSAPYFGHRAGDVYGAPADAFAVVRARRTAQDRVAIVGRKLDLALLPKSATVFRIPGIFDYEALVPQRYADFFTYLRTGHPLATVDEWQWVMDQLMPPTLVRPL